MSKRIIKGLKKRYPKHSFEFVTSEFDGKIWSSLLVNGEVTSIGYHPIEGDTYERDNTVYKIAVTYLEAMKGLAEHD
jgi:hypothetical protein